MGEDAPTSGGKVAVLRVSRFGLPAKATMSLGRRKNERPRGGLEPLEAYQAIRGCCLALEMAVAELAELLETPTDSEAAQAAADEATADALHHLVQVQRAAAGVVARAEVAEGRRAPTVVEDETTLVEDAFDGGHWRGAERKPNGGVAARPHRPRAAGGYGGKAGGEPGLWG